MPRPNTRVGAHGDPARCARMRGRSFTGAVRRCRERFTYGVGGRDLPVSQIPPARGALEFDVHALGAHPAVDVDQHGHRGAERQRDRQGDDGADGRQDQCAGVQHHRRVVAEAGGRDARQFKRRLMIQLITAPITSGAAGCRTSATMPRPRASSIGGTRCRHRSAPAPARG